MEDDSPQSNFFDDLFDTANSESLPVDEMNQYLNSTVNDGKTYSPTGRTKKTSGPS